MVRRKKKVTPALSEPKPDITNYGIKRRFGMNHGNDMPAVAIAVNNEGFYFEQNQKQSSKTGTTTITFVFPDGPTLEVKGTPEDDLAYQMARLCIEEGILTLEDPKPETVADLFPDGLDGDDDEPEFFLDAPNPDSEDVLEEFFHE